MSSGFHLLLIDDDQLVIDSVRMILPKNWRLTANSSLPRSFDQVLFHAAFVDMHLEKDSLKAGGLDVMRRIAASNPNIEIIAMSGDQSLELMEDGLKHGATKFLSKPLSAEEFVATLEKIEALWQMRTIETRGTSNQYRWLGASAASQTVLRQIASLRGENGPILIEGETGTGKEVAFRLLNQQETNRPAVTVNIASIPETLFESELFGHTKGAFTGADSARTGLTEAAHGGDLFLDEIEAMPLPQQVKLLRFLETGEIRKVGAKDTMQVKVRVIAASNQNLATLVKEGKFREDLLFRLAGKQIQLPPLRDRRSDIAELAEFFLDREKSRSRKTFSAEALATLALYNWPGNVRELKRVCEQLLLTAPLPTIRPVDVTALIHGRSPEEHASADLTLGLAQLLENHELHLIKQALAECNDDVEKTASLLKVSRSSLYQKIKNHRLLEPT